MICFAKHSVFFRPQNRELPYQECKFCPKGLNARVIQLQDWKGHQKTTLLWHPIRRSPNTFCISNAQHFWCWWWLFIPVYVWYKYVLCKTVDLSLCLLVNCQSRWSLYCWLFVLIIQSHHHSIRVPPTDTAMYYVPTCGMFCTTLLMLMMIIYPCLRVV